MSTIECKIVTTEDEEYHDSLRLRQKVLRKPIGLDIKDDDLSIEKNAYHVLAYNKSHLVGTLFLLPLEKGNLQMKQVAVDPAVQGQGIGKQLVNRAEEFARQKGYTSIKLHARINAWPFYESCGYTYASEAFEEKNITHKIMKKELSTN